MPTTLLGLARELAAAAESAPARCAAVVAKGALNVKNEARRNAEQSSGTHAAKYPSTIGYDLVPGLIAADIGPERRGQGNLGPILEGGSVHNSPHRDLGQAVDNEEPRFLAEAAKLASPWG